MISLTMFRFCISGDFGYASFVDNKQIFRVSGAYLPDNPVKIQIGCDYYRSTYTDDRMFGVSLVDNLIEIPIIEDRTVRFIKNTAGEPVAQLCFRDNYYILTYGGMNVEIRSKERKYIFSTDDNIIATIQKSGFDKHHVPNWMKAGNSYTWENALELSYQESLPEILIGLIFAFPMLRFDYYLRKKGK